MPVVEQRLGILHAIIASFDAECSENSLGFFGLERIIGTVLVLLDNPRRVLSRFSVRRYAAEEKIERRRVRVDYPSVCLPRYWAMSLAAATVVRIILWLCATLSKP